MDNNELLLQIIDTAIWPLTLIGFLLYYRKEVKNKLVNLQSAKFSVDGTELFFKEMEDELKNPQDKLNPAQPAARGIEPKGRGTEPKGRSADQKNQSMKPKLLGSDLPPYRQLFMINSKIEEYLRKLAAQNNLSTDGFESLNMIDTLTQKGIINLTQRDKLVKITKLIRSANPAITKEQVDIVRKYYDSI